MTAGEALVEGAALLRSSGADSPSLDASLLLCEVLGMTRARLLSRRDAEIDPENEAAYRSFLDRRKRGECLAYILGRKEFRGLDFLVSPAVLVPRPDTEILVEAALEAIDASSDRQTSGSPHSGVSLPYRVLDACTGSGCVAIAIKAERPQVSVAACDLSPAALDVARANSERLLGSGAVEFFLSDLLSDVRGTFDLIVSNPPYVPGAVIDTLAAEVRREPRLALDGGEDGLDLIRRLARESPARLGAKGRILIESGPEQSPLVAELLRAQAFVAVATWRDLAGRERVAGGMRGP